MEKKNIISKLKELKYEIEKTMPPVHGSLSTVIYSDLTDSEHSSSWSISIKDDDDSGNNIVIETDECAIYLKEDDIEKMINTLNFFKDLSFEESEFILGIKTIEDNSE